MRPLPEARFTDVKHLTAVPAARNGCVLASAALVVLAAMLGGCGGAGAHEVDEPGPGGGAAAGSGQAPPAEPGAEKPPPDAEGGQSGDPGSGGPSVCNGERWDGPQATWIRARCAPFVEGQARCECSEQDPAAVDKGANEGTGTQAIGDAEFVTACRAALRDECEIDPDAPVFCGLADVGTCWPGEDDSWSCECGAGVQHRPLSGSACERALWQQCGERCETPFGTCGEVNHEQYRCQCTGVVGLLPPDPEPPGMSSDGWVAAGGVALRGPATCAGAMSEYCGDRCQTSAGSCAYGADGFACTCSAGGGGMQAFADVGGITPSACGAALQRTCGEELNAPLATCTQARARCEAAPRVWSPGAARPDSYEYACRCDGAAPAMVEARTCYSAMMDACPAAIDVSALLAPAAARQVGASCLADGDCAGGICHVGRLGREGVCSAPCAADSGCPAGAVCAFAKRGDPQGRCFFECRQEYGCERLNDAFDDPLLCGDHDFLPFGRLLRDDESGELCAPISDHYWPLPVRR